MTLDQLQVGRRSDVAKPLTQLAAALRKRGMVVLISDLLDDPDAVITGLRHLRFRGSDVVVFHLVDPAEVSFPFESSTRFRDLETGEEVTTIGADARDGYLRAMRELWDRYEHELRRARNRLLSRRDLDPARYRAAGLSRDAQSALLKLDGADCPEPRRRHSRGPRGPTPCRRGRAVRALNRTVRHWSYHA